MRAQTIERGTRQRGAPAGVLAGPSPRGSVRRERECKADVVLMDRLAGGEPKALRLLYDRHAGVLLALARRIVGSLEDAEEIVQEALLHAWNRAETYDSRRSSVITWLGLITRSRAIDRLRSRRTAEQAVAAVRREGPSPEVDPDGGRKVLAQQRRERVLAAIQRLPDEQRQVVHMAYYQGLSQREIAAETDTPIGTVKTRAVLAMRKLRRSLAADIRSLL